MDMKVYIQKLGAVIDKIVNEGYEISPYYAERLLAYLDDDDDGPAAGKQLRASVMYADLIYHCIDSLNKISVKNQVFLIDLVTSLFKNELQFNRIQLMKTVKLCMIRGCIISNLKSERFSSELQLASVRQMAAFILHTSGFNMLVEYKLWDIVLIPGLHKKPASLAKASYEFMSQVIWRLDDNEDDATLSEVLTYTLSPVRSSLYLTETQFDCENETSISDPIIAPLNVLLTTFSKTEKMTTSKILIKLLKMDFLIEKLFYRILIASKNHDIICLVNDVAFRFHFALLKYRGEKIDSTTVNEIIAFFVNEISFILTAKRMIPIVIEYVIRVATFWFQTGGAYCLSEFERNGMEFKVENQFIIMALTPILCYICKLQTCGVRKDDTFKLCFRSKLSEHFVKIGYMYRDLISEKGDFRNIALQAIRGLYRLKGLLQPEQAGLIFHTLYGFLEVYVTPDETTAHEIRLQMFPDSQLLSHVLDIIKILIIEHNINWYEYVEIIRLQKVLVNLMKEEALPGNLLIKVLDLIELSISKFLSPDMMLLVESRKDSALEEVAVVLQTYLQHHDWGVRDSALKLLLSCTNVAFIKYVPLQSLISENRLILQAAQAAISDSEYYVQAAALRCLAAATKIELLWRQVTGIQNIYKELLSLLRLNPEGMVRREAAVVLTRVYIYQKTQPIFDKYLYKFMLAAAVDDLHWEVQLAALQFWMHVIKKQLENRGMIDGKFPKVTFSKEKKKIVILDQVEVKRQLTRVLYDLSDFGCLTALHMCLNEDFNIEVTEQAYSISQKLIKILDAHGYDKAFVGNTTKEKDNGIEVDEIDMALDLSVHNSTQEKREETINSILNSETSDLIMNISVNTNFVNKSQDILLNFPDKFKINPKSFLDDFFKTNYLDIIKGKGSWNTEAESLDQLLDDIIEDTKSKKYYDNT